MTIRQQIRSLLERIRALDPEGGWLYYLDLLDVLEDHREEIRGADWPADFPELEVATYRGMLILVEDELRSAIKKLPLAKSKAEFDEISGFLGGLFTSFVQRADAVVGRLDPDRVVQ